MQKQLYEWRKKQGLTQVQVGNMLGLAQASYCRIENGTRSIEPIIAKKIEQISGGKVKRKHLRPDIFGAIE